MRVENGEIRHHIDITDQSALNPVVVPTVSIGEDAVLVSQTSIASDGWVLDCCKTPS